MPSKTERILSPCRMLGAAFLAMAMSNGTAAAESRDWQHGPSGDDSSWGGVCAAGTEQSPIALNDWSKSGQVRPISFNYKASNRAGISNTGYTIAVSPENANTIEIGGETYRLAQFHFHTHSEHVMEGKRFPMEVHLVHVDDAGNPKLVVGVLIADDLEEGSTPENGFDRAAHTLLGKLQLPPIRGESGELDIDLNVMDLLPVSNGEHSFERVEFGGSLTTPTPTCSEGLTWIVMREPLHTTPEVIARFHDIMGDNYRRVQPLNGRQINCCGESDTIN